MPDSAPKIFTFKCEEVLTHGITGKKHVCGKVITSLYKGQFDYWKAEHLAMHKASKKNTSTLEALANKK
jgi:hypothetical protein